MHKTHPKTHLCAVVIIPPHEVWGPIQEVRREHDKGFRRWMPHVTLLYPFAPKGSFNGVLPDLAQVGWEQPPFELTLAHFRWFRHGQGSYTVWLAPEPEAAVVRLHAALVQALPGFADTGSFRGGFSPHLSVGQVEGTAKFRGERDVVCTGEDGLEAVRLVLAGYESARQNAPVSLQSERVPETLPSA